jgi:hypothetical protein
MISHLAHRAFPFLPFKGRTEEGMGLYSHTFLIIEFCLLHKPIPIPSFPLKGKVRLVLRR